jgi:hypothetical protein
MPRISAAARAVAPVPPESAPIRPPATLSEPAKVAFAAIVADCDPHHFKASDVPLLAQYAVAIALAERAEVHLSEDDPPNAHWLAVWKESVRTMRDLALRLRLSPQARRERAKVSKPLTWSEQHRLQNYGRL